MISIVVPVYNEEGNLALLNKKVGTVLSEVGEEYELIFVDDGSSDHSVDVIRKLHREDPRVKLLSFSRNFGHQIALTAGIDHATGDAVIVMDADLQHPPELIPELIKFWKADYDIVYTVRETTRKVSFFKKFTSCLFYKLFKRFAGLNMPGNTADFRLMDRKVANCFMSIRERTRFLRGLTTWVGYRSKAISYQANPRYSGESKYHFRKMLHFSMDAIISFSTIPLRISIYLGFIMTLLGFLMTLHAIYIKLFTDEGFSGFATIIVLITIIGGVQLILLGFVGLYIGKIFEETKKRPLYIIREALGVEKTKPTG